MDIFKLLKTGVKFNKQKYSQDSKTFHTNNGVGVTSTEERLQPVKELDFFGTKDVNTGSTRSKQQGSTSNNLERNHFDEEEQVELKPIDSMQSANEWRKKNQIKVYGTDIPHPFQTFSELFERYQLKSYLKKNITSLGYDSPTAIQMQSIPIMLHGRDLIGCSTTGSGKTLSFLVPLLHELKGPTKEGFRALIITPTRELASQINRELSILSKGKPFKVLELTKASNITNQNVANSVKHFDILISTPLRLVHAIQQETIKLDKVNHLVLDEADKLLELGFLDQVDDILSACTSPNLHKSLFSATITSSVEELGKSFMKDPLRVVIGQKGGATDLIEQKLLYVGQEEGKLIAIRQFIQQGLKPPVLIFVQSIDRAKELFHELVYDNINVDVIHSERTETQRQNIIQNFRQGKIWVLIATEVIARGIDFKGVNVVVNYDFPQTVSSYIHRIGRTGRAGRNGLAITYFTKEDTPYLKSVVNVMKESGCEVPEWMLNLKKPTKNMKKNLKQKPLERKEIKTTSKYDEKKQKRKREMVEASQKKKLVKAL